MGKTPEYSDRYLRNLIPFIGLSILVHLVILGGALAYASLTGNATDVTITLYAGTNGNADVEKQPGHPNEPLDPANTPRHRIYRIDYFNTLLLETPIKSGTPRTIKPILPKPEKPIVKPETKPVEKPAEKPIEENTEIPTGKVMLADELNTTGEVLMFPEYRFTLIPYNDRDWLFFSSQACRGYDMVYFVVDISKKDGFEEYFEWAKFLDFLFSIEGVKDPPTPVGIAEMLEDPYYLTPEDAADSLRLHLEKEEYKTEVYKNYNFVDFESQIINGLKISELPQPQVYFVDYTGAVRMKLEGRISEIPLAQIRRAVGVIKEIWGMTDLETALAMAAIVSYQQKLVKENPPDNMGQ